MSVPWWDGPLVAFDVETTAPDPELARIVSVAVVTVGPARDGEKRSMSRWSALVKPSGFVIPQEAIDVHGITNERADEDGRELREVLEHVTGAFEAARALSVPVVMHNARYDFTVADREARRLWLGRLVRVLPGLRVIDPLVIEKHLDRYRPKRVASHSLEDCCRVWNVPLEGVAHDASFDAIAAVRLAWRLGRNGFVKRRVRSREERAELARLVLEWEQVRGNVDLLHEWQRRVAWDEAERLEQYFRVGDPGRDVPAQPDRVCPREWPIIQFRSESEARHVVA